MEIQWENVHALLGLRGTGNSLEQCLKYYDPETETTKTGWFKVNEVVEPMTGRTGYRNYDWQATDWDKTTTELWRETGINRITIDKYRKIYGHKSTGTAKTRHVDWRSLDWDNKNDNELARENGIGCVRTVNMMRHRLGKKVVTTREKHSKKITPEMIADADWANEFDIDIARRWNVTRERVRQVRQAGNHPRCRLHQHESKRRDVELWMLANREKVEGMLATAAADLCPVEIQRTGKLEVMKKLPFRFIWIRRGETGPHLALELPINWALPNLALSMIWDKTRVWIANCRSQFNKKKSRFIMCGGYKPRTLEHHFQNDEFTRLVIEDIKKAQALGIKPDIKKLAEYGLPVISHNHTTTNNDTHQTDPVEHSSNSAEPEGAS